MTKVTEKRPLAAGWTSSRVTAPRVPASEMPWNSRATVPVAVAQLAPEIVTFTRVYGA